MLTKLENIKTIIDKYSLDENSVVLVTNHIMAKCLIKNKWIICHVMGTTLIDCREYEKLEDAIQVVKLILGDGK